MKTKRISKIYLIAFAIVLALLSSFSIALTASNNADAKDFLTKKAENPSGANAVTYQYATHNFHGHTVFSNWDEKNITDGDIVDYDAGYDPPLGFSNFKIDENNNLNSEYCIQGLGRFGIDFCTFDTSGGEYIVGMRVNCVDVENYQWPSGIFLRLTDDPTDLNVIELIFSTTQPPVIGTEIQCTFNSNGGILPGNNSENATVAEKYLYRFTLPAEPTKEGLGFKCWCDAENTPITADNSFFKTENNTFTAKWFATLSYDLNGGEGPEVTPVDYDEGATANLHTGEGISKTDDTLLGWNTSADGTGQHYDLGSTITMTKHTKLYAEWLNNVPEPTPSPDIPAELIQTGDTLGFAVAGLSLLALASSIVLINTRRRRGLHL